MPILHKRVDGSGYYMHVRTGNNIATIQLQPTAIEWLLSLGIKDGGFVDREVLKTLLARNLAFTRGGDPGTIETPDITTRVSMTPDFSRELDSLVEGTGQRRPDAPGGEAAATHFVKVLRNLEQYARQAGAGTPDWESELFADLTHNGVRILYDGRPETDRGPEIALHGTSFFALAGIDNSRDDTLFIHHVERAHATRTGNASPHTATFLLSRKDSASATSVRPLFCASTTTRSGASDAAVAQAGPSLLATLAKASAEVRRQCHPRILRSTSDPRALLDTLSQLWSRHRLGDVLQRASRASMILGGNVPPTALTPNDVRVISEAIDVALLNAAAARCRPNSPALYELAVDVCSAPTAPGIRALVWASTLRGLEPADLIHELYAAAPHLSEVLGDPAHATAYESALLRILQSRASYVGTQLRELLERATASEKPLAVLVEWASGLEIRGDAAPPLEREAATNEASPAAAERRQSELPLATPPAAGPETKYDERFERWLVSLRMPNATDLVQLQNTMAMEFSKLGETDALSTPLASLRATRAFVDDLANKLDLWRRRLPSLAELDEDEHEARL